MSDGELIVAAIEASGLSLGRFARLIGRNKRTLERWRAGRPVPAEARDWLTRWLMLSDKARQTAVSILAPPIT